jgi:hypothetical protein
MNANFNIKPYKADGQAIYVDGKVFEVFQTDALATCVAETLNGAYHDGYKKAAQTAKQFV